MTEEHFRRSSDLGAINLEALIAAENDPGKRTLLLILSSLNYNLIENTKTTEAVRSDLAVHTKAFSAHEQREEAFINKGKGAWTIMAIVLSVAQVAIAFALVTLMDKIATYDKAISALQVTDTRLEGLIKQPHP